MVSRKMVMRHEPDIGLMCCSTCSKITSFSDEKMRMTTTPLPSPHAPRVSVPKRLRVCRHPAHMCFNMCAWCRHTRGRFESTHGDVWIVSHPTTPHTQHNTTHEDSERKQRQRREREREEKEDRQREDKTKRGRRDKTRRREKRQETRDEREDERQDERI